MLTEYLKLSFSIAFISWIVGMLFTAIFKNAAFYQKLSNINLIRSERLNKRLGIGAFKWIVLYTPFKFFNAKIKLRDQKISLKELRIEMTYSDINHLVGFCFVSVFALIEIIRGNFIFALFYMVFNVLMNLYPCLLQQFNKRRIDSLARIKN